jgi:hypothetical protein
VNPPEARLVERARETAQRAARRTSLIERVSRARGRYEREESQANYIALLEAELAWARFRLAEAAA